MYGFIFLKVIEDADLAAILKEADPENFEPHLNDDDGDDDDSSSNDNVAPTSTREASMTAGTMSDSIPDAVGRSVSGVNLVQCSNF